ncbi:hypothetical protein J132_03981 [Termitomyces sp. J132]|nr:hypothetical protein J132_03981 [Termitomyces sp. J132]
MQQDIATGRVLSKEEQIEALERELFALRQNGKKFDGIQVPRATYQPASDASKATPSTSDCHDPFPETPHIAHQTPEPPKGPPTLRRTSAHALRLLRLTPTPPRLTLTAPWPTSVPAPQPLTLTLGFPNPENHPRYSRSSPPIINSTPCFLRPIPEYHDNLGATRVLQ